PQLVGDDGRNAAVIEIGKVENGVDAADLVAIMNHHVPAGVDREDVLPELNLRLEPCRKGNRVATTPVRRRRTGTRQRSDENDTRNQRPEPNRKSPPPDNHPSAPEVHLLNVT